MDHWKVIENCTNYAVSLDGRVMSLRSGNVLVAGIDRYGYEKIHLRNNEGGNYYTTVHRLVARAFVHRHDPKHNQVNHKDGDKRNNHYTNLEWCSNQQNIVHSYELMLNQNTNRVILKDITTGEEEQHRSVKSLGKRLKIHISVLMPLIKNSGNNPILGRWEIRIVDVKALDEKANTTNFGRAVYVYDGLTCTFTRYPSVLIASYHTCLRSLSTLTRAECICSLGFIVSFDETAVREGSKNLVFSDNLTQLRKAYYETPYVPRDFKYRLYDYYSGKETEFCQLEELASYMNENLHLKVAVTVRNLVEAISRGKANRTSGIIRGYGIKSDQHGFDWSVVSQERLLCSEFCIPFSKVYRVDRNGETFDVYGLFRLAKLVGHLGMLTQEEIMKTSLSIPGLCIERLDKPVKPTEMLI